jgi:hypothetical protein
MSSEDLPMQWQYPELFALCLVKLVEFMQEFQIKELPEDYRENGESNALTIMARNNQELQGKCLKQQYIFSINWCK